MTLEVDRILGMLLYATVLSLLSQVPCARSAKFVEEGPAGPEFAQWEISYYAHEYKPLCGVSLEAESSDYWSNSPECEVAMSHFNTTTEQVQVYDTAGSINPAPLASGQELCLCYALLHSADDVTLDICMLFGAQGQIIEREAFLSGDVAVGLQSPDYVKKALPQCDEIDLSPYATTTGGAGEPDSSSTSTAGGSSSSQTSGTTISDNAATSSSSNDDGGKDGGGLSTEAIIALGCGIPGALVALAAIFTYFKKCYRREPRNDHYIPSPMPQPMVYNGQYPRY